MIVKHWEVMVGLLLITSCYCKYEPNWKSLDSRPLPSWYDEAKVGIFLHWGVFSVPSFASLSGPTASEWFWRYWKSGYKDFDDFMKNNYHPDFTYADFAHSFRAELYNPYEWAKLFSNSGAKYVVLTSKHHEGFCNWPSNHSFNWNAGSVGPKRDLVGDLASAIRKSTDMKFGLYHSWYEWFNPLWLKDKQNHFQTNDFVTAKTLPEWKEIVINYQPDLLWADGHWDAPDWYWNSTVFLSWLYNESPVANTVVVNDRWGKGCDCRHGGFWNCQDRYHPSQLLNHKWENAFTLDKGSWGLNRISPLKDYLTREELLYNIVTTVAYGGNALVNIGPAADGTIYPIFQQRLSEMGNWLNLNGEAIYGTKPCSFQNDTLTKDVFYTCPGMQKANDNSVYATFFDWPKGSILGLGALNKCPSSGQIELLGVGNVDCHINGSKQVLVDLNKALEVIIQKNLQRPWTLKFIQK